MIDKQGVAYYRRYPAHFIRGTEFLSFEVKGAYSIVLDLLYIHGGRLPDERFFIAKVLGCSSRKWSAIRAELIVKGKLQAADGFLSNRRVDKELAILADFSGKQAERRVVPNKNKALESPDGLSGPAKNSRVENSSKISRTFSELDTESNKNKALESPEHHHSNSLILPLLPTVEEGGHARTHARAHGRSRARGEVDLFTLLANETPPKPAPSVVDVLARLEAPGGALSPPKPPEPVTLDVLVRRIISACPPAVAARKGVSATKVKWALKDAKERGENASRITAELVAYYEDADQQREDGKFAMSPRTFMEGDWQQWRERGDDIEADAYAAGSFRPASDVAPADGAPVIVVWEGVGYEAPPGKTISVAGDERDPGPGRQCGWLERFEQAPQVAWKFDWGPRPGEPGCRVWPSVLERWNARRKVA